MPEPLTKKRFLHPANLALAVIAVAFMVWEVVAALIDAGKFSVLVTLSEYVWFVRNELPWLGYPVITLFCLWLWFHFTFQGPH